MADELGSTIMTCTQVSVANKVAAFLTEWEPSFDLRLLYTLGASVLVLINGELNPTAKASSSMGSSSMGSSSSVVTEIVLTVATTTILSYVAIRGYDTVPISLAQSCTILLFGDLFSERFLGRLARKFTNNIQYIFANTVSAGILGHAGPALSLTSAFACVYGGGWSSCYLAQGLGLAGISILKSLLLNSIPRILKLPTITAIVCLANPLQGMGLGAGKLFGFALYQASDSLQDELLALMSMAQAVCVAAVLTICAPTPVFRALGKITLSSLCTDAFFQAVQEASDTDPFLCLTALLVVLHMVVRLLEKYSSN